MNREQAKELLNHFKDFPTTEIFSVRPINYPLFHLLECFCKGWRIEKFDPWNCRLEEVTSPGFETMAVYLKADGNCIYQYVARNPRVKNSTLGYVHEDLYARYVGGCNPLKIDGTTWRFIPFNASRKTIERGRFDGKIGGSNLYLLEIDNETTDIFGKWDENRHWSDLQMTIDWKPWKGRIEWQEGN